jgi:hypothetical protein
MRELAPPLFLRRAALFRIASGSGPVDGKILIVSITIIDDLRDVGNQSAIRV